MWEYKIMQTGSDQASWQSIAENLNELGYEGWELVNVLAQEIPIVKTTTMIHYFKRWTAEDE